MYETRRSSFDTYDYQFNLYGVVASIEYHLTILEGTAIN